MDAKVITRFAPSPTGLLHLGNMRTSLFNFLLAKSKQGRFLLRIEDTDKERSKEEFVLKLQEDLRSLGLRWDKNLQGDALVFQSAREHVYNKLFTKLLQDKSAYPCFCTKSDLEIMRKLQLSKGMPPRYDGRCKHLTDAEVTSKQQAGVKFAVRFDVGNYTEVEFIDLIQGHKTFLAKDIGDFIIKKSDGSASFFFSNAVDDAHFATTHVLRGEDHLTNTPRQLLILQALGLTAPAYGHLPLLVGEDGKPLSKRNGSVSIRDCIQQQMLPIAILNYLARLGHKYAEDNLLSIEELSNKFSLEHIGRSPAKFDAKQLEYWQKEAVKSLSDDEFITWLGDFDKSEASLAFIKLIRDNVVSRKDVTFWQNIFIEDNLDFDAEAKEVLLAAGDNFYASLVKAIEKFGVDYASVIAWVKEQTDLSGKKLFKPLRIALTSVEYGPHMQDIFEFLGKDEVLHRLARAFNKEV